MALNFDFQFKLAQNIYTSIAKEIRSISMFSQAIMVSMQWILRCHFGKSLSTVTIVIGTIKQSICQSLTAINDSKPQLTASKLHSGISLNLINLHSVTHVECSCNCAICWAHTVVYVSGSMMKANEIQAIRFEWGNCRLNKKPCFLEVFSENLFKFYFLILFSNNIFESQKRHIQVSRVCQNMLESFKFL